MFVRFPGGVGELSISGQRREFIRNEYPILKKFNPGLPIYVRPCEGAEPFVAVRLGAFGFSFFRVSPGRNVAVGPRPLMIDCLMWVRLVGTVDRGKVERKTTGGMMASEVALSVKLLASSPSNLGIGTPPVLLGGENHNFAHIV